MRTAVLLSIAAIACGPNGKTATPRASTPHILRFETLSSPQIAKLDRARTVLLLPGGVLEQHGPHLPVGTDGLANAHLAGELAESLAARAEWTVVVMPHLPLGVGGANEIGGHFAWPGSVGIRVETLRAVYMDLASQLGDQGFRWIFVLQDHGSPLHNQAIDDACAYFEDQYRGGRMVNLTGLVLEKPGPEPDLGLSEADETENGVDIHAGMSETSRMLHIQPDLVASLASLRPWSAATFVELLDVARRPGWPGYFGSPRLATAGRGRAIWREQTDARLAHAHAVLEGTAPEAVPFAQSAVEDPGEARVLEGSIERDRELAGRQRVWLEARGPNR